MCCFNLKRRDSKHRKLHTAWKKASQVICVRSGTRVVKRRTWNVLNIYKMFVTVVLRCWQAAAGLPSSPLLRKWHSAGELGQCLGQWFLMRIYPIYFWTSLWRSVCVRACKSVCAAHDSCCAAAAKCLLHKAVGRAVSRTLCAKHGLSADDLATIWFSLCGMLASGLWSTNSQPLLKTPVQGTRLQLLLCICLGSNGKDLHQGHRFVDP